MLSRNSFYLTFNCFSCIFSSFLITNSIQSIEKQLDLSHNKDSAVKLQIIQTDNPEEILETKKTLLQVTWAQCYADAWIGIWDKDPLKSIENPLHTFTTENCTGSAEFETNLFSRLPKNLSNQSCLDVWVGIVKQDALVYSSCLEISPFWMWDNSRFLRTKRIYDIVVPGLSNPNSHNVINGKISSWYQLLLGYRYFELEVSDEQIDSNYEFIINNGNTSTELKSYVDEIVEFLNQTKEMVFIELTVNPYSALLENDAFYRIQEIVYDNFYSIILTSDSVFSMEDAWKVNRRLIFFINNPFDVNITLLWKKMTELDYNSLSEKYPDHMLYLSDKFNQMQKPFILLYDNRDDEEKEEEFISFINAEMTGRLNFVILSKPSESILKYLSTDASTNSVGSGKSYRTSRTNSASLEKSLCKEIEEKKIKKFNASAWITLQAKEKRNKYRLIKMNWKTDFLDNYFTVALFDKDPSLGNVSVSQYFQQFDININIISKKEAGSQNLKPLAMHKIDTKEGNIATDISFGRPSIDVLKTGECLGYFVAIFHKNDLLDSRCIKAYPQWMWDSRENLAGKQLRSVVIPGNHNAGVYSTRDSSSFVDNYIICQEDDIISQLLYGNRYLDLRVGYYPDTKELLWINHDKIRWTPLKNILEDVRIFTTISKDPVIIHIHRTPVGFDHSEARLFLARAFEEILGDNTIPNSMGKDITFKNIWRLNKTVIICYGNFQFRQTRPYLWPVINQVWANANEITKLKKYFDNEMENSHYSTYFWAAMTELTPNVWDVFTNPKGLRGFADDTNSFVTKWLRDEWKNNANIMAMDFFHSSNIIYTSIELNCQNMTRSMRKGQQLYISFD